MSVVLIVEDDAFIRDITEVTLHDWGYDTLSASDVDEALVLLRSDQRIDALFTDIFLKTLVFGGCDLARQAIELRPNLRILYVTGNALTGKIRSQFVDGAQCLRKPYTPLQLQDSLAGLLAA
jgi:CheY-like chemotaxis protein